MIDITERLELICVGNVPPMSNDKVHQRNFIYHPNGIANALTATMYKDPPRIIVEVNNGQDT